MLLNFSEFNADARCDVVIVGAGAVGLTMAVDLARRGRSVVLLEAGTDRVTSSSQQYFEGAASVGHPLPGLHLGRFRALGGTTNFWGGQCVRFDPSVFERRDWISEHSEWPFNREELDPFYDRALALLNMRSAQRKDQEILANLAIEYPVVPSELSLFLTRWAPEPNFARLFDSEIRSLDNLRVVMNANVTSLIVEESKHSVAGLVINNHCELRANTIVLANGTFEIVRLLLLPLHDKSHAPWSSNVHLGRGFVDHIDYPVGEVLPINKRRFHQLFDNAIVDGVKYQPKLKLSDSYTKNKKLVGVAGHFVFNSSLQEHFDNAKIMLKALRRAEFDRQTFRTKQLSTALRVGLPMALRYLRHRRVFAHTDRGIQLRVNCEQKPIPTSRIQLARGTDLFGLPNIEVDWRIDGSEMDSIIEFSQVAQKYLSESGVARLQLEPKLALGDPSLMKSFEDMNHHMGAARMSRNKSSGVVDENLRIHEIDNLYVVGAAVFPTTGFANPTFTAIALGLRLSQALAS